MPDDVAARDYPLMTAVNPYFKPADHEATFSARALGHRCSTGSKRRRNAWQAAETVRSSRPRPTAGAGSQADQIRFAASDDHHVAPAAEDQRDAGERAERQAVESGQWSKMIRPTMMARMPAAAIQPQPACGRMLEAEDELKHALGDEHGRDERG